MTVDWEDGIISAILGLFAGAAFYTFFELIQADVKVIGAVILSFVIIGGTRSKRHAD